MIVTPQAAKPSSSMDDRDRTRFNQLTGYLERAGIASLSDLGDLRLNGVVAPQPGVAIPAAGGLAGPVALVQIPRVKAVTAAGLEVDSWRPVARALQALPQVQLVDQALIAARTLELSAGTTLVIARSQKYLTILAEKLIVGDNVTITWERDEFAEFPPAGEGQRGDPDHGSEPATVLYGSAGGAGGPGTAGNRGWIGADAPTVEIWTLELDGSPRVLLRGQAGGYGQRGGRGGAGGRGEKGRHELYEWWGPCKSGAGWGGNGGDGGPGGRGGDAGVGGHGGEFALYAPEPAMRAFAARHFIDVSGGASGAPGGGGSGGSGGEGGQMGDAPRGCALTSGSDRAGHSGADGPEGQAGTRVPDHQSAPMGATMFTVIDEARFREKWTAPAVLDVVPSPVLAGDTATVHGARFQPTDEILIDLVAHAASYQSATELKFVVPSLSGGPHRLSVRQRDGTESNPGTLTVGLGITRVEPAGRLRPGSVVTVFGSGFNPGARVRVNGQDMPEATYLDPGRMTFRLVRPANLPENPDGEPATLQVFLPTSEGSNTLPIVIDTYRMLVFGDSVAWGQGLSEARKYHSLVQAKVSAREGGIGVYKTVLAHSGANVGIGDVTSKPGHEGEVPYTWPTIAQQIEDPRCGDPETVDLVLLNGGINDINLTTILNPLTSVAEIDAMVARACYRDMRELLLRTAVRFPAAEIVVSGYFPIISEESDLVLLGAMLLALGVKLGGVVGGVTAATLATFIKPRVAANCRVLWERSSLRLQEAVDEVNDRLGAPRISFALPAYTPANAALAPQAWVFGLNADLSLQDDLGVREERVAACELAYPLLEDPFGQLKCKNACIGHPNITGAEAYARAIDAALDRKADPLAGLPPFPAGFLWGAATSSYQNEGGIDGNDWALFTTSPTIKRRVETMSSKGGPAIHLEPAGDAVGHRDLAVLRTDLDRAAALGMTAFRFSLEWSRLQPTAGGAFDAGAAAYYDAVLDELKRRGMEPIVTLNHLSLPQWVLTPPRESEPSSALGFPFAKEDGPFRASLRGWETEQTIDAFLRMVTWAVGRWRDRVRYWMTINEPVGSMVGVGYIGGVWPPGFTDGERARRVHFNLIRAHVRAYDAIKAIDSDAQVGFAHAMMAARPTQVALLPGNVEAAARNQFDYFINWHFLEAVIAGAVDTGIARRVPDRTILTGAAKQNFFGAGVEVAPWKPRCDFLGVNYYRSVYVFMDKLLDVVGAGYMGGRFANDLGGTTDQPHGVLNALGWEMRPEGLYEMLAAVRDRYGVPVMITENGLAEPRDADRAPHLVAHLQQVLRAIGDGVDVRGYLYWTLVDNWELQEGYRPESRFGLFRVQRDAPGMPRHAGDGALAFRHAIAENHVDGAAERFGTMAPTGGHVRPPTVAPRGTWDGAFDDGRGVTLVFTRLRSGRLSGLMNVHAEGAWIALSEVSWDGAAGTLRFEHAASGSLPARRYEAAGSAGELTGTYAEGARRGSWRASRLPLAGLWSAESPRRLVVERTGGPGTEWRARYLADGPGSHWRAFDEVTWDGVALHLVDSANEFTGSLSGDRLAGVWRASADQVGTRWEARRVADGLPFGQLGEQPRPAYAWAVVERLAFADSSKRTAVDLARLDPGQRAWIVVRATNLGSATWSNGPAGVRLATAPQGRASVFKAPGWLSAQEPATLVQTSVAPDATATVEFGIVAPATPGSFDESFNLVAGTGQAFAGAGLSLRLVVRPPAMAWTDAGGATRVSHAALAPLADQRLALFARGADERLWQRQQTAPGGAWEAWKERGKPLPTVAMAGAPAVGRNANGRLSVFLRGSDGALWQRFEDGNPATGWSKWTPRLGALAGDPVVAIDAGSRMCVFAIGPDGSLAWCSQKTPSGDWSGWNALGRPATTVLAAARPAVAATANGRLVVVARGGDNALWQRRQSADGTAWTDWSALGRASVAAAPAGDPALARNASGTLGVFTRGSDGALWHRFETVPGGAWSAWTARGGKLGGDPAATLLPDGRMAVYATLADGTVGTRAQATAGGNWVDWSSLGRPPGARGATGPVLVAAAQPGRLALVVRDPDGGLWQRTVGV